MKKLKEYIIESTYISEGDDNSNIPNIKFIIWESPDNKVRELKSNTSYQKIEYKFEDKDKQIFIDFLLGFIDNTWKLWIGKIGSCSYDDDPYYSLDTDNFKKALILSLEKIDDFINKVKEEPDNYIQFYKNK